MAEAVGFTDDGAPLQGVGAEAIEMMQCLPLSIYLFVYMYIICMYVYLYMYIYTLY